MAKLPPERQAAALRANLKRRKAAERAAAAPQQAPQAPKHPARNPRR